MLLHQKKLYAQESDRKPHALFVEAKVIVPHETERVGGKQICSHCADGFRIHYKRWIAKQCFTNGGDDAFFHTFSGNGEPMRFACNSALSMVNPDDWGALKMMELYETLGWAKALEVVIDQLRVVHHWPCKAALDRNIGFEDSIDLVVRGKLRIKWQLPIKVGLEMFIDWSQDEHTTHLIKKEPYIELLRNHPPYREKYEHWLRYEELVRELPVFPDLNLPERDVA